MIDRQSPCVKFKFSLNGKDNEMAAGLNHLLIAVPRPSGETVETPSERQPAAKFHFVRLAVIMKQLGTTSPQQAASGGQLRLSKGFYKYYLTGLKAMHPKLA